MAFSNIFTLSSSFLPLQKIPFLIIIGKKEMEEKSVTLRSFGSKDQEKIKLDNLTDFFEKKCMIPGH